MGLAQKRDFIIVWLHTAFGGVPLKFEWPILYQKLELRIYLVNRWEKPAPWLQFLTNPHGTGPEARFYHGVAAHSVWWRSFEVWMTNFASEVRVSYLSSNPMGETSSVTSISNWPPWDWLRSEILWWCGCTQRLVAFLWSLNDQFCIRS